MIRAANDNLLLTGGLDGFTIWQGDRVLRTVPTFLQAKAVFRAFEEVNARFLGLPIEHVRAQ